MTGPGAAAGASRGGPDLLGIYLNDHLAGATAGVELARRMARAHRTPPASAVLRELAAEVAEDRAALITIMSTLSIPVRGYKTQAAWLAEKAGRLKFNGRLVARSPLSTLEELELFRLAVTGKAAGWRTLHALAQRDQRLDTGRLDELLARAARQEETLEDLRRQAAGKVIEAR